MQVLFFDTETTGVPKNYQGDMRDVDNWPRIIQICWQVARLEDGELICGHKYLIRPDGWIVPKEKFWLDHGYSTEKCQEEGKPMDKILDMFISFVDECDIMVAHNMNFDYNILGAEMIRYGRRAGKKLKRFCTMELSMDFCKIPAKSGRGYKWPRLEELHVNLFSETFEGAHDAGSDVTACRKCFFELVRRDVIKLSDFLKAYEIPL